MARYVSENKSANFEEIDEYQDVVRDLFGTPADVGLAPERNSRYEK